MRSVGEEIRNSGKTPAPPQTPVAADTASTETTQPSGVEELPPLDSYVAPTNSTTEPVIVRLYDPVAAEDRE